jgi:uncharacterized CHY-type Zn-finger protein
MRDRDTGIDKSFICQKCGAIRCDNWYICYDCDAEIRKDSNRMWPIAECCGKEQNFVIEPAFRISWDAWLVCKHCKVPYRPIHKKHNGGATPDGCEYCQNQILISLLAR